MDAGGEVLDALDAQHERLDQLLGSLEGSQWNTESQCPGWTIGDVILHLAQTEEAVVATVQGRPWPMPVTGASTVDEAVQQWVEAERGLTGPEVHQRWDSARRRALTELRAADPQVEVAWVAAPLKPLTLATTRLSEHWIHTLDVAAPFGIEQPDTDGLRHIARLAIRTVPYAYARAGRNDSPTVRAELTAPSGERWSFGVEDAPTLIQGPAGTFCRIAARRLRPEDAPEVICSGPGCEELLNLVRTYA